MCTAKAVASALSLLQLRYSNPHYTSSIRPERRIHCRIFPFPRDLRLASICICRLTYGILNGTAGTTPKGGTRPQLPLLHERKVRPRVQHDVSCTACWQPSCMANNLVIICLHVNHYPGPAIPDFSSLLLPTSRDRTIKSMLTTTVSGRVRMEGVSEIQSAENAYSVVDLNAALGRRILGSSLSAVTD